MSREQFVKWRPDLTPEDEAQIETAVGQLKRRISMLRALREQLGMSQAELSEILETTQSNVSKMEAGDDPRVSTLRRIVEHQGGRLKVVAEFADREVELSV